MLVGSVLMGLVLLLFTVTARSGSGPALLAVFLLSASARCSWSNLQMRLMQVAGDAQTIGAAMNHASLNIANALGAWLGGVVVAAGLRLPRRRAGSVPALSLAGPAGADRLRDAAPPHGRAWPRPA